MTSTQTDLRAPLAPHPQRPAQENPKGTGKCYGLTTFGVVDFSMNAQMKEMIP
jgi:hypothetical protein